MKVGMRFAVIALMSLFLLGCSAFDKKPDAQKPVINLAHLEHLQEMVEVEGAPARIVHIYTNAPEYNWVVDDDEGEACVDDVARAVRVYLNLYAQTGDSTLLKPAREMLNYVMALQADDGEFYNFNFPDGTINRTHKNSVKSLYWWAARGFRALSEAYLIWPETDDATRVLLKKRIERTVDRLESAMAKDELDDLGFDALSEWALGLYAFRKATDDTALDSLGCQFAKRIHTGFSAPTKSFPYGVFRSWENTWHAYGMQQGAALAYWADVLDRPEWLHDVKMEAKGFHRWLIAEGMVAYFEYSEGDTTARRDFSQIAYDVNSLIACQMALYDVTGNIEYALTAGIAGSWFRGQNRVGAVMYDETTGRGYDGINSPEKVNRNAGAESTIEALLAMEQIARSETATWGLSAVRRSPWKNGTEKVEFSISGKDVCIEQNGSCWDYQFED